MYLDLKYKTGFAVGDNREIVIYEGDGETPFYVHRANKLPCYFNLPPGQYVTNNKLVQQSQPRKYKLPELPPRQREGAIPERITWAYGINPNKASIFREKGISILDKSLAFVTRPQRVAIKLHELAHYFYKSEEYCDRWATRMMLRMGFNPSQAFRAVQKTLSNNPDSLARKGAVLKNCERAFK